MTMTLVYPFNERNQTMPEPTTPATPAAAAPLTRRGLEARIIAKAWKDPKYKGRLLRDPKGVLQDELKAVAPSVTLPEALQVDVHEETPNQFHLVLPRNPHEISLGELLGDDLEAVAPQTVAVVTMQNATSIQSSASTVVYVQSSMAYPVVVVVLVA
jgi:hypothetical protein